MAPNAAYVGVAFVHGLLDCNKAAFLRACGRVAFAAFLQGCMMTGFTGGHIGFMIDMVERHRVHLRNVGCIRQIGCSRPTCDQGYIRLISLHPRNIFDPLDGLLCRWIVAALTNDRACFRFLLGHRYVAVNACIVGSRLKGARFIRLGFFMAVRAAFLLAFQINNFLGRFIEFVVTGTAVDIIRCLGWSNRFSGGMAVMQ